MDLSCSGYEHDFFLFRLRENKYWVPKGYIGKKHVRAYKPRVSSFQLSCGAPLLQEMEEQVDNAWQKEVLPCLHLSEASYQQNPVAWLNGSCLGQHNITHVKVHH